MIKSQKALIAILLVFIAYAFFGTWSAIELGAKMLPKTSSITDLISTFGIMLTWLLPLIAAWVTLSYLIHLRRSS